MAVSTGGTYVQEDIPRLAGMYWMVNCMYYTSQQYPTSADTTLTKYGSVYAAKAPVPDAYVVGLKKYD